MEPHRPKPGTRPPLDESWLEQVALRYAARWETTEKGVCDALTRKLTARCAQSGEEAEALFEAIPSVAARLVERGYVDDRRFAAQLAGRLERQGRSRAYLESKLRTKGVSDEIIEGLLSEADPDAESEAAWRIARKRRLGPYSVDPEKRAAQRDKQLGVLARQGFSLELASKVVDAEAKPEES